MDLYSKHLVTDFIKINLTEDQKELLTELEITFGTISMPNYGITIDTIEYIYPKGEYEYVLVGDKKFILGFHSYGAATDVFIQKYADLLISNVLISNLMDKESVIRLDMFRLFSFCFDIMFSIANSLIDKPKLTARKRYIDSMGYTYDGKYSYLYREFSNLWDVWRGLHKTIRAEYKDLYLKVKGETF
jgi:hypothetical protein